MAKLTRYHVDFSDLFVEADDEDEALRIVSQKFAADPRLPQVCEVSACDDASA